MARERMAKLIKYGHSEAISCHIMTCVKSQVFIIMLEFCSLVVLAPRLHMKIWLTPWHPPHRNVLEKNYLSQIECWNLQNEAKTTRNAFNLSVNFVVPLSCQLSPYYFLSFSRISSTSHGK